jgi:hypothetical protein
MTVAEPGEGKAVRDAWALLGVREFWPAVVHLAAAAVAPARAAITPRIEASAAQRVTTRKLSKDAADIKSSRC